MSKSTLTSASLTKSVIKPAAFAIEHTDNGYIIRFAWSFMSYDQPQNIRHPLMTARADYRYFKSLDSAFKEIHKIMGESKLTSAVFVI